LTAREGSEPHTPGELVEDVDRHVVEHREGVNELRGFHAPVGLEAETDPPPDRAQSANDRTGQRDPTTDHRARDDQGESDQEDPRVRASVPQARDERPEDRLPVPIRAVEHEDRERDAKGRVQPEPNLPLGEVFAVDDLPKEIVSEECERSLAEIRDLDQVRQDIVAVELEQRDEVEDNQVVAECRGRVQRRREEPVREPPNDQRRGGGQDHVGERPGERRGDLLPAVHH
jgi:hypothetical protein